MFRSPLMMGGDLPSNDTWTTALLTNLEVLAIDQDSAGGHPVWTTDEIVVWAANTASDNLRYLALFNLGDAAASVRYSWQDLGFAGASYRVRDLWERRDLGPAASIAVNVPAHGVALCGIALGPSKPAHRSK
ncbi:MAG TPA: hypothetical protein VFD30_08355 [Terriglobia bacterium]|nr:hypothetical protein [Terriglobia bacterium]